MSGASLAVLDTLDTIGQSFGMPDRFTSYGRKFELVPAKGGGVKKGKGEEVREPRDVRPFSGGEEVAVSPDLSVRPLPVDHSLPGASAFVVYVDGRTWVYTGDLRFHGTYSGLSRAFVDAASLEDVDVLLCEGTRVGEPMGLSEQDVRERITDLIEGTGGLVLANYPARDLDRITTFWEAARAAGRELVVDTRQALLLENLGRVLDGGVPTLGDHLRVFARRQVWGVVGDTSFPEEIQAQDYGRWERPFAFSPHRVLDHEVAQEQDRYVFFLDFYHLQVLMDLKPRPGSVFIRSLVEPFNEEMEMDEERVDNWFGLFGLRKHQVHASGHACGEDLRELIESISPRVVVPIHTERPGAFANLHGDVRPPGLGTRMEL
jgi:ribonuclease J